jgi:MFS family permease
MGSGGYGLLLGAVGVGAVAGAFVLPGARARWSADTVVAAATVAFVATSLVLAWVDSVPLVALALVLAGLSWIAVLSSLNASAQTSLPAWVRARGMATYLLVFQGGQAVGSALWGMVATHTSLRTALTIVAAGLLAALATSSRRHRLSSPVEFDLTPSVHWAEPEVQDTPLPGRPILVRTEYRVPRERHDEFREVMRRLGRSRRRTGAERWSLYQDAADLDRFVENYVVRSWEEHMRQHYERLTKLDEAIEQRARELTLDGDEPRTEHLIFAYER